MMKLIGHMPARLMCAWIKDDNEDIKPVFMAVLIDPDNKGMAKYIPLSQDKPESYDEKEFMNIFQHHLNIEKEKLNQGDKEL